VHDEGSTHFRSSESSIKKKKKAKSGEEEGKQTQVQWRRVVLISGRNIVLNRLGEKKKGSFRMLEGRQPKSGRQQLLKADPHSKGGGRLEVMWKKTAIGIGKGSCEPRKGGQKESHGCQDPCNIPEKARFDQMYREGEAVVRGGKKKESTDIFRGGQKGGFKRQLSALQKRVTMAFERKEDSHMQK